MENNQNNGLPKEILDRLPKELSEMLDRLPKELSEMLVGAAVVPISLSTDKEGIAKMLAEASSRVCYCENCNSKEPLQFKVSQNSKTSPGTQIAGQYYNACKEYSRTDIPVSEFHKGLIQAQGELAFQYLTEKVFTKTNIATAKKRWDIRFLASYEKFLSSLSATPEEQTTFYWSRYVKASKEFNSYEFKDNSWIHKDTKANLFSQEKEVSFFKSNSIEIGIYPSSAKVFLRNFGTKSEDVISFKYDKENTVKL